MKIKSLLVILAVTGLLACKKERKRVNLKTPETVSNFERSFVYVDDNQTAGAMYPTAVIKPIAKIEATKGLIISLATPFPTGTDQVAFLIPNEKLKAGYVGAYEIGPNLTPMFEYEYQYQLTANSSNRFFANTANGILKITKFNTATKAINGEFNLNVVSDSEPKSAIKIFRNTTIRLSGSFADLVVK